LGHKIKQFKWAGLRALGNARIIQVITWK